VAVLYKAPLNPYTINKSVYQKVIAMPVIQANIIEGRTNEEKEALIHEITQACHKALGAPLQNVRVLINEMPKQHFGIAGESVKKLGR